MKLDGSERTWLLRARKPDWHPRGDQIISQRQIPGPTNIVSVFDLEENEEAEVILHDIVYSRSNPEYSPDGRKIAFHSQDGIWVANADGSNPVRILLNDATEGGRGAFWHPSWHPDGKRLVYEHFRVTKYVHYERGFGDEVEGYYALNLINVDSAMTAQ